MANTITSVLEIREAGVLLTAEGTQVVRVLGAVQQEHIPPTFPMKEDLGPPANMSVFDRYYAGELQPPAPNPNAPPDTQQVPALFITQDGEPVFLVRNVA